METPEAELPPIPTEGGPKEEVVKVVKPKKEKAVKKVKAKGSTPKAEPKKAEKPKATKVKKEHKPRAVGPGTKKFKFKAEKTQGKCDVLGCSKSAKTRKSFRCAKHTRIIRKQQLKANNQVWHKRIENGTAKHHAVYNGHVTKWSERNPDKAKAYVKAGRSIVDIKAFVPLLVKGTAKVKEKAPTKKLVKAKSKKAAVKKAA